MHIQYYLVDGQEIDYLTSHDMPTMEDVNIVAMMYAKMRQNVLPEYIFISVRVYQNFMMGIGAYLGPANIAPVGRQSLYIHTAAGPLVVRVMPWASDAKLLIIGREDDYERYDLDKVFEETVLKDCEREQ